MNWFEYYYKKVIIFEILLRKPFFFFQEQKAVVKHLGVDYLLGVGSNLNFSVSLSKEYDDILIILSSFLYEISLKNKVFFKKKKNGNKWFFLTSVLFKDKKTFMFLDFFLNKVSKMLQRRYIVLSYNVTETGVLALYFSNVWELELDEFFFFDMYFCRGSLSIKIKISSFSELNFILNKLIISNFRLTKYLNYEVFDRKG